MNTFKAIVLACLCFIPLTLAAQSLPLAVELDARSVVLDKPANVLERHHLNIQPQLLRQERVAASLLHQHRYRLEAGEIESRGRDSFTWRGRIVDDSGEAGSVTLSVRGNRVRGQVHLNRHNYQISTDHDGNYWMDRLDPAQMPPAHPPGGPLIPEGDDATPLALQDLPVADESGEPPVVDVIVFYTESAISRYADEAAMRFAIRSAVDANNTGLINSEVPGRMRLVGTFPIDYDEPGDDGRAALDFITTSGEAALLRNRYSADLVAIISNDTNVCGIAWLLTRYNRQTAHSMTSALTQCLGGQTFAHELGHNLGLNHDPENAGTNVIETFAYGHFVDWEFRTIMSYSNECPSPAWQGCPRIDHFSDPDVLASGIPTGTTDRNNAEVLRRTMPVARNWRQQPATLAEASGLTELDFETGGDGVWVAQNDFVHGNDTALLSAPVMADEIAWLEAAVMATESFDLGFYARTTVADSAGVLNVYADGALLSGFDELSDEWTLQTVSVPAGTDSLRWEWTSSNGATATQTGAVAMAGLTQGSMTQTSLYGQVVGPTGLPVDEVLITVRNATGATLGSSVETDNEGYFDVTLTHPADADGSPASLLLSGTGVTDTEASLDDHNCENEAQPCTLQVEGEAREINGQVSGLLEGDEIEISAGAGLSDRFTADGSGGVDFSLTADALVSYGPLTITAPEGYQVTTSLPDNIDVRDDDFHIAQDIELTTRAPQVSAIEVMESDRQSMLVEAQLNLHHRDSTVTLTLAAEDHSVDMQQSLVASEGNEQTISFDVAGLECGTRYAISALAVNDHDREGSSESAADTNSCPGSGSGSGFGCSLGNPERKDPLFGLLLILAVAGIMRANRRRALTIK